MLKTDKKTKLLKVAAIAMAMAFIPFLGHAAGLGKIAVYSALGQPLKAEIEVTATADELSSLQAKLASADAFRQADVEYNPVLSSLKFSRGFTERNGHRYIQVTTDRPVNEPFINMLVEMNWASGRLVREYTFLLDPPDLGSATANAPVSPPPVPLVADNAQPAKSDRVDPIKENAPSEVSRQSTKLSQPSPAISAKTSAAANGKSHKVRTGDTLGKIAAQTRPEGVSLEQVLVALLHSNQEAFDGGNMNRLKAGKILAIPDAEVMNQISTSAAKKEIVAQAADFNAYRKRLASSVGAQAGVDDKSQQAASGKITPKVEDNFPAPNGKDKLDVSRTENAKGGDSDSKARVAALEADLLARDKALKEAQSRTAELEKSLSKLKQLTELKSKAGADLQQQAQTTKPALTPANPVLAVVPPSTSVASPTVAADKAPMVEPLAPSTETVKSKAPVSPPSPKPQTVVVPPSVPEPEPDFLEKNSTLILGGGGILALLLGWLGLSAWKKKKEKVALSGMSVASDFLSQSTFGPSVGAASASSFSSSASEQNASQFSVSTQGAVEPFVDALSQADTFLAFGRHEQAEEILLSALETQPERHALYLKLLEIYAEQDKPAAFETLAKRFHDQTAGEGPDWEMARSLGVSIDPDNALYQLPSKYKLSEAVTGDAVLAGAAVGAVLSQTHLGADVHEASGALLKESQKIQDNKTQDIAYEQAQEIQAIDTETLDFDLDFDLDDIAAPVAEANPSIPALATRPEMSTLDFNLDLDLPDEPSAVDVETSVDSRMVLDAMPAAAPLELPLAEEAGNSIDFDFDLPLADVSSASATSPNLKLDTIDLDLDADLSAPTFGEAAEEGADNPEVSTKLELAAAYEEMGDNAGATELYQEALIEGSKPQQEFARAKLASLA